MSIQHDLASAASTHGRDGAGATVAAPAGCSKSDEDDIPDAVPVSIDEVGESFSWRDFGRFIGEPFVRLTGDYVGYRMRIARW